MNGYCVLVLVAALITLGVSRIARQITFHPFQTGYNAIKDLYYYQLHRGAGITALWARWTSTAVTSAPAKHFHWYIKSWACITITMTR